MKILLLATISLLAFNSKLKAQSTHLGPGDQAPIFSLLDADGHLFNSQDYTGKKILVVYFYPKDESSVCTKEACSFRDRFADFTEAGALVVGINHAPPETHKKFQLHHKLPFLLLSDPGNKVLRNFGVKNRFFLTGRETFVINRDGKIVFRFDSFTNGTEHMEAALKYIRSMK